MVESYSILAIKKENFINLWGFKDIFNFLHKIDNKLKYWLNFKLLKKSIKKIKLDDNKLFYITIYLNKREIIIEDFNMETIDINSNNYDFKIYINEDKISTTLINQTPIFKFLKLSIFDLGFKKDNFDTSTSSVLASKNGKLYFNNNNLDINNLIISSITEILSDTNLNYYNKLYTITIQQ